MNGLVFPLMIPAKNKYIMFPWWAKLTYELKKEFDITEYNGKTIYHPEINDFTVDEKLEYRLANGDKWNKLINNRSIEFILQHHIHPYLNKKLSKKSIILTDSYYKYSFDAQKIRIPEIEWKKIQNFELNYYQNARTILTLSNHLRNHLLKNYNLDPTKVKTVYPGTIISPDKNYINHYNHTILFVGNPFQKKGGDNLLKAFETITKKYSDAKLIIVSNVNREDISKNKNIELHKFISFDNRVKLKELYEKAGIVVIPTHRTNFLHTLIESMAFKLPYISTNVFGANNEIDKLYKKSGILINDDTEVVANLIKNISYLFDNPGECKRLGNIGYKKYLKYFTMEKFVKNISKEIKS